MENPPEGFPKHHAPCAHLSAPAWWHRGLQSATVSINRKDAKVSLQLNAYSNPKAVGLCLFVVEACLISWKLIEFWVLSIPRAVLAQRRSYEGPWRWPVLPTACHTTRQSTSGCSPLQTPYARDNQMTVHKSRNVFTTTTTNQMWASSLADGSCVGPSVPGRGRVTMPFHVAPISIWKDNAALSTSTFFGVGKVIESSRGWVFWRLFITDSSGTFTV